MLSLEQILCQHAPRGCNYKEKNALDCIDAGLRNFNVPENSDSKIESIFLSGNKLQSLNGSEVSRFAPNTVTIDLNRNNFEKIRNDTFKTFPMLQVLHVSNNRITHMESDSFNHLKKLKKLYLWGNKLQIVRDIWFRYLGELEQLHLQNNRIKRFLPSLFKWPMNLSILLLQSNSFHIIPPIPPSVKNMNLTGNKVDCSCQRKEHQEVNKNVLHNVHVTCESKSTETWMEKHWNNPYCAIPTVQVLYKEINEDVNIVIFRRGNDVNKRSHSKNCKILIIKAIIKTNIK